MIAQFELAVVLWVLVVLVACGVAAVRDTARGPLLTASLVSVQVVVVVQALLDVVELFTARVHPELATHIGYLAVSVIALPAAAGAMRLDPGRWGSAGLALGCLVVAVVSIRLHQTLGMTRA